MVWDLVLHPKWPSSKLDLEIIKTNTLSKIHDDCFKKVTVRVLIRFYFDLAWWPSFSPQVTQFWTWSRIIKANILSKIHDDCFKNVTARVLTRFSFDLVWWPRFWPQVTQFLNGPRNHQDKHFGQNSWWLLKKMWSLECEQGLPLIWPGDLVFYSKWPSFKLDLEIIKTNILSKIHDDCFINVTARVSTRFYTDLAKWPSFRPQVIQFWNWSRNHQDKHFGKNSWWLLQKSDL